MRWAHSVTKERGVRKQCDSGAQSNAHTRRTRSDLAVERHRRGGHAENERHEGTTAVGYAGRRLLRALTVALLPRALGGPRRRHREAEGLIIVDRRALGAARAVLAPGTLVGPRLRVLGAPRLAIAHIFIAGVVADVDGRDHGGLVLAGGRSAVARRRELVGALGLCAAPGGERPPSATGCG